MIPERETIKKIENVLTPILQDEHLELVEIAFQPIGKRWLLRIYIDKEGGVTIADCERVNRELGRTLDVEDFIEHPFVLEVSSPGLTRPLKTMEDFTRYRGRLCKIVTTEQIYGKNEFRGEIVNTTEEEVEIKGKIDVFTIPLCAIKKANLEFEL
jgi:ribosome maturation factor RimP